MNSLLMARCLMVAAQEAGTLHLLAEFDESLHPRDEAGKFTDSGGGSRVTTAGAPDRTPNGPGNSLVTPVHVSGDVDEDFVETTEHLNETQIIESDDGNKYLFKPVRGENFREFAGEHGESTFVSPYVTNQASSFAERETLAPRVAQELGIDFIPETFYGHHEGNVGSFQEFINEANVVDIEYASRQEMARMGIFDAVIGNVDRHQGNMLEKNGKLYAIDNGLSFGTVVPGTVDGFNNSIALRRIAPRDLSTREQQSLARKVSALDPERLFAGSHLNAEERKAFTLRRDAVAKRLAAGEAHLISEDYPVSLHGRPVSESDDYE